MNKPLRIFYAAGPGDVIATYRHWVRGEDDPQQVSMTISGMFYDLCRENGDKAYVVSSCTRIDKVDDEQFQIVHRPTRFTRGPSVLYYLGQLIAALHLIASAVWFRADVAVISCGTTIWLPLRVLPWLGIPLVPSLHCVLRPKYHPLTRVQDLIHRSSKPFFSRSASQILSMSSEISDQVKEVTNGSNRPILQFLPTYRSPRFAGIPAPQSGDRPFRVLFAGRIEKNKGVFDLLTIATSFDANGRRDIVFDVCGTGAALKELQEASIDAGIDHRFRCHGYCDWQTMRQMYSQSHAVIVPTTSGFIEGFNQVISEAILAGRPVITSAVCPALAYVRDAVVEVAVDDVAAYGIAILKLCDDSVFYREKCEACLSSQNQFYDLNRSWLAALRQALSPLRNAYDDEASLEPVRGTH